MSIYVYILRLDKSSFYTGMTNDIRRRMKEHESSKKGYTSKFSIKEIVFIFKCVDRKKARKIEIYIKNQGAKRFLYKHRNSLLNDQRTKYFNINRF